MANTCSYVGWHMEYGCAAMRLALSVWPNPTAHIDGTNGHVQHCIIWMTHIDTPAHLNAGTRLATIPSTHAAGLTPLVGSHWHLTHNRTWVWDNTQSNQPMAHLHTETIYIMIPIWRLYSKATPHLAGSPTDLIPEVVVEKPDYTPPHNWHMSIGNNTVKPTCTQGSLAHSHCSSLSPQTTRELAPWKCTVLVSVSLVKCTQETGSAQVKCTRNSLEERHKSSPVKFTQERRSSQGKLWLATLPATVSLVRRHRLRYAGLSSSFSVTPSEIFSSEEPG